MRVEGRTVPSFNLKDCAIITIATGVRAYDLRELRDRLAEIPLDSVYYHFWGQKLRFGFEAQEFYNDFAAWAYNSLSDPILAERLANLHPENFPSLEALRDTLIDMIEDRLYELDYTSRRADTPFYFIRGQLVVFDTYRRFNTPEELVEAFPTMSLGSLFFHFIDARRRTPERIDDFRVWLANFQGVEELVRAIAELDPYFITLLELRERLSKIQLK